ncbi:hypothetical protein J4218_05775 [Candidatus Pacearchaeota archaeon]|nr:hypothetical protein [Candidatus Pacearchaeota archaeon]
MKKSVILLIALVLIIFYVFSEISATVVFQDYFLTDPNSNGKWNIKRGDDEHTSSGDRCVYSSSSVNLAGGSDNLACSMAPRYTLTSKNWSVDFDFKFDCIGDCDSSNADGIFFWFYSKYNSTNSTGNNGYGIDFDIFLNSWDCSASHIGVMKFNYNHLTYSLPCVNVFTIKNESLHHAKIYFNNGTVTVYLNNNNVPTLTYTFSDINYSEKNMFISAVTGNVHAEAQIIDNFILESYPDYIACSSSSQCGTDGFTGSLFCQSGNVFQNYTTYTCNNPGQASSSCSDSSVGQLTQTCSPGTCYSGACCTPKTCAANYSGQCGSSLSDSCGGYLNCADNCGSQTCNATSGFCYTPCVPKTCADYPGKCGTAMANGTCSGIIDCSLTNCLPGQLCNATNDCYTPAFPGNATFQDMNGNNITFSQVNDLVKLVLFRQNVNNSNISYKIYYNDTCTGFSCGWRWLFGDFVFGQFSSIGFLNYKPNQTGNFYFNATVQGASDVYSSNTLNVSNESNAMPRITIIKPIENSSFIIKSDGLTNNISFEQVSSDEDDLIDVYWDFDDGNTTIGINCNNGTSNCNNTHSYNSSAAGTRIINATALETTRSARLNQHEYDLDRIFIYKEELVLFVIIDKPNYKNKTFSADPIQVDARSTHVANCSYNSGVCNATALLIGRSCYNITDSVNISSKIYCYKYANSSDARFNFTWVIDGTTESWYPTNSSPFTILFPKGGEHEVGLKIKFNIN